MQSMGRGGLVELTQTRAWGETLHVTIPTALVFVMYTYGIGKTTPFEVSCFHVFSRKTERNER